MGKRPCGCLDLQNVREIEPPWRWGAKVTIKVLKKEKLKEEGPSSAPTLNVRVLVCDDATCTFVGSGVLISQGVGREQIKNALNVPILCKLTFSAVGVHRVALNFGQFTRVPPRLALKPSAGSLRSPLQAGAWRCHGRRLADVPPHSTLHPPLPPRQPSLRKLALKGCDRAVAWSVTGTPGPS